jgi:hypothetical protein
MMIQTYIHMPAEALAGTNVRVRRGRRGDLPRVLALLGRQSAPQTMRLYRRVVADLGTDLYVAEDAGGQVVGLVSIVYSRSLFRGALSARLDGARAAASPAAPVLDGLIAFAERRARRRGCRRLEAPIDGDPELHTALLARGYRGGEALVADLGAHG